MAFYESIIIIRQDVSSADVDHSLGCYYLTQIVHLRGQELDPLDLYFLQQHIGM